MAFRIRRRESIAAAVRRIATEQLDRALAGIADPAADRSALVHRLRQRFKMLRGLLRLMRSGLDERCDRWNATLRDAGRSLSRVRDAESLVEAVRRLRSHGRGAVERAALESLEAQCVARRQRISDEWRDLQRTLDELAGDLRGLREEFVSMTIAGDATAVIDKGFRRTYRQGQRAMRTVRIERTDETLHEWRKRSKGHWYHLRLLRSLSRRGIAKRIDAFDRLNDRLGDDHDLAVLCAQLDDPRSATEFGSSETRAVVRKVAARRRCERQRQALRLGAKLFADSPREIARRLRFDQERGSHAD